jgi:hypothetical protein
MRDPSGTCNLIIPFVGMLCVGTGQLLPARPPLPFQLRQLLALLAIPLPLGWGVVFDRIVFLLPSYKTPLRSENAWEDP